MSANASGFAPEFRTRLFGRDAEVASLETLIANHERLITLLGPAGVGKTRIAHQIAVRRLRCEPPRSAWFVDLASAVELHDVVRAIEDVLDPEGQPVVATSDALRMLATRIGERGPTLIVLDNCEQATPAVAAACQALLPQCPHMQLLATSRARLQLSFERIHHVAPLAIDGQAALDLIKDRMTGSTEDVDTLRAIVARLDGLPLALELAAARLDARTPAALLGSLASQLDELDVPASAGRTLRGAITSSWRLLDARQRTALSRLSVFRGGFTLRGAGALLGDVSGAGVEAVVRELVDRSLVRAVTEPTPAPRFAMYEGLREYAANELATSGMQDEVERRHAMFLIAETRLVADWNLRLRGRLELADKRAADLEHENLLAALDHMLRHDDREAIEAAMLVAGVLASIDLARGTWEVAVERLSRALDHGRAARGSPAVVADTLGKRAYMREQLARYAEARADIDRAIELAPSELLALQLTRMRTHVDSRERRGAEVIAEARRVLELARDRSPDERSLARLGLASALHTAGAIDEALATIDDEIDDASGGPRALRPALYLAQRGAILVDLARFDEAVAAFDEAITFLRARNATFFIAQLTYIRTMICVERGDPAVEAGFDEVRTLARASGDARTGFLATVATAFVRARAGDLAAASGLLASVESSADKLGSEPQAFFDLVQRFGCAISGDRAPLRDRIENVLIKEDLGTPLLRCTRRVIAGYLQERAGAGELTVSPDTSSVVLSDGRCLELAPHKPPRYLLHALVTRHRRAPGDVLSVGALAAEGWPGEVIDPRSAQNRVHVTLSTLRRGGLREILRRSARGYFVDPAVRVRVPAR